MLGRAAGCLGLHLSAVGGVVVVEVGAPPQHQRQHPGAQQGCAQRGDAPAAGERGQSDQEDGPQRPAQVAAEPVRREGVAQAWRGHAAVEDGEVGRVHGRIAQAGQGGGQHQASIALCGGRGQGGGHVADHGPVQHRAGAMAIHHEAGQGLPHAGDDEEHGEQQAELGIAEAELPDEHREQRRQQHVVEVGGAVAQADQADGADVLAGRVGCRCGLGGMGRHPSTVPQTKKKRGRSRVGASVKLSRLDYSGRMFDACRPF